jgi:hypothetical protein
MQEGFIATEKCGAILEELNLLFFCIDGSCLCHILKTPPSIFRQII